MDNRSIDNSEDSILGCFPNNNSQKSEIHGEDSDFQFHDDTYMEIEIMQNCNLDHKNVMKILEFGINRNACGPYEFGIQFNAKFFMNIIREYYLKLNNDRLNLFICDRIIYIYGHYYQKLKIYTKINTHIISSELVDIIEGHSKEFRANFEVASLLKLLEFHSFGNKEIMKMYFSFNKNQINKSKVRERNLNALNPFAELQAEQNKFESEFNFDDNSIPGNIIIETQTFKFSMESIFAPLELSSPPQIPSTIFSDYILSISIDKLGSSTQRMNPLSPLEIYCNHYICNFIANENSEKFLTYDNSEGVQFKYENALNFCKNYSSEVDESNLYLKMINFTLKKYELDALKIINKKSSVIHFFAGRKEKYYFTKETDDNGNIASAVILCTEESKPLIKDIEDCCLYQEHWNEWINYLGNILPKDCINELEKMKKLKDRLNNNNKDDDINASTNKHKKRTKEVKKKSINSINNNNIKRNTNKNIIIENNDENKENELKGLFLYANDKKGSFKKISFDDMGIRDLGREENIKGNEIKNKEENKNKINPFAIH